MCVCVCVCVCITDVTGDLNNKSLPICSERVVSAGWSARGCAHASAPVVVPPKSVYPRNLLGGSMAGAEPREHQKNRALLFSHAWQHRHLFFSVDVDISTSEVRHVEFGSSEEPNATSAAFRIIGCNMPFLFEHLKKQRPAGASNFGLNPQLNCMGTKRVGFLVE